MGELKYATGIFGLVTEDQVNWETDKIVSFSQYSKYTKCPKSWELAYVRKHKIFSESIHLVYGQAMHSVIQQYLHTCYVKTVKKANELDLNAMLMDELKKEYKSRFEKTGKHFSNQEQLAEFYTDGVEILKHIKSKRSKYFPSKDTKLMAIELPLTVSPDPNRPTIKLQQHLDLVFYDTDSKVYTILDLKTSTRGWNDAKKKDKATINQLVLYKKTFCEKFNLEPDQVKIEYFIMRQKVDPDSLWPIKRVSQFSPASGKVTMSRLAKEFQEFLNECFDATGQYQDKNHPPLAGANYYNCRFCEYDELEDLCPKSKRITHV